MWIVNYIIQLNITMWLYVAGVIIGTLIIGKRMEKKGYSEEKIEEVINDITWAGVLGLIAIFLTQLLLRQLPIPVPMQ